MMTWNLNVFSAEWTVTEWLNGRVRRISLVEKKTFSRLLYILAMSGKYTPEWPFQEGSFLVKVSKNHFFRRKKNLSVCFVIFFYGSMISKLFFCHLGLPFFSSSVFRESWRFISIFFISFFEHFFFLIFSRKKPTVMASLSMATFRWLTSHYMISRRPPLLVMCLLLLKFSFLEAWYFREK